MSAINEVKVELLEFVKLTSGSLNLQDRKPEQFPIIVHSHLQWDWVWQRPQQFLSRLSKHHPILFVEGPKIVDEDIIPRAQLIEVKDYPNVTVMQTEFPRSRWNRESASWVDQQRYSLLRNELYTSLKSRFNGAVQWFYDPMAAPIFLHRMNELVNVYDCMDELSQFRGAPPELIEREQLLLREADVVFTGGKRMWDSKSRFNSNCHFYGCGVDRAHFARALGVLLDIPDDMPRTKGATLGYFGVIDERIDYELLSALAESDASWNIVMIGPMTKIDPATLPQHRNLHWMGGRSYDELPGYAKAFDVCLMPFALNEATEYINPTKALEYMSTGTPIVSSAISDVITNFGDVVKVTHSHQEFIEACRAAYDQPDYDAVFRGLNMARMNSWEQIVDNLEMHIKQAIHAKQPMQPIAV